MYVMTPETYMPKESKFMQTTFAPTEKGVLKMRLIDADALLDVFENKEADLREPFGNYYILGFSRDMAKALVQRQPTIESAPVVHSQWDTVFYEKNGTIASYSHLCPECKYFYRDTKFKGHDYCPNCGAKMDGGVYDG